MWTDVFVDDLLLGDGRILASRAWGDLDGTPVQRLQGTPGSRLAAIRGCRSGNSREPVW